MKLICTLLAMASGLLMFTLRSGADTPPAAQPAPVQLDDFESGSAGWDFASGAEFPGSKGSMTLDSTQAHSGKNSLRLEGDFTGGGMYVGCWRHLDFLKGLDFNAIHIWVKSDNVKTVGIRIADQAGQTFQTSGVALPEGDGWHEWVLKVPDLIKGEHWGGANDGKWRGPAAAFGINIGHTGFISDTPKGALNFDDISVTPGAVVDAGQTTLLSAVIDPPAVRPGYETKVTYRFDAQPMGRDFTVFVHGRDAQGKLVLQADHDPESDTATWSGKVQYTKALYVPIDTPDGEYHLTLGMYDHRASDRGWDRPELKLGPGVTEDASGADGKRAYIIGTIKVDSNAPLPILPKPTLDLSAYKMTFDDEFKDLSISESGPDTRWFTATKDNFGDARFMPEKDGFPFSLADGIVPGKSVLRIAAEKKNGVWESGIIASADPKGGGFSQKMGYFEMRAKMPNPEIDVVEAYGVLPNLVISTMHVWNLNGQHIAKGDHLVVPGGLSDAFHNYGVLIDDDFTTFYFDGIPFEKQPTLPQDKVPLYMLVNLAMGSGWPIDKAVSPSYMYVDYVRAYAKK
jgi:hypothetical protein